MYQALRAASVTLRDQLVRHFDADPDLGPLFTAGGGTLQVSLETPDAMRAAPIHGLSVWLYRIVRDDQHLNDPPRRLAADLEQGPPLPLRLHYMLTPILPDDTTAAGGGPEREQAVLGRAMQRLYTHPVLRGSDLRDLLTGTGSELTLRLEPLTLEEVTRVWASIRQPYQLSVSYEMACALIDPAAEPVPLAPVTQVGLDTGLVVTP